MNGLLSLARNTRMGSYFKHVMRSSLIYHSVSCNIHHWITTRPATHHISFVQRCNFAKKNKQDKEEKNNRKTENGDDDEERPFKFKDMKEFFHNNQFLLLLGAISSTYLLYLLAKDEKEISYDDAITLVNDGKVLNIDIDIHSNSEEVLVHIHLKNLKTVCLQLFELDSFINKIEQIQMQKKISYENFLPIKIHSNRKRKSKGNLMFYFTCGMVFAITYSLYKRMKVFFYFKNSGTSFSKKMFKNDNINVPPRSKNLPKGADTDITQPNFFDFITGRKSKSYEDYKEKVNVKFSDIAGMEHPKMEISEFVEFLKTPDKFVKLGARIPRGALLEGPPGTGKTLLAKAVAGEAGVPFFAVSGSDFNEMYIGLGAKRIRELFRKAKSKSPSIIFIDEFDSVAKARSEINFGNNEKESTLNQLLSEMDGFETNEKVIVLASTNRRDLLDSAVTRSGRFDRTIHISLPKKKEREDILKLYLEKVKLDSSKSLEEYASLLSMKTAGYSGADLSNLVNEAAILSARESKDFVDLSSLENAYERKMSGYKITKPITNNERQHLAYYNVGKIIVAWFLENGSPYLKTTIIPNQRNRYTQKLTNEFQLFSKEELRDRICMQLAGRVCENIFLHSVSDQSRSNLLSATEIARNMVTLWGMTFDHKYRSYYDPSRGMMLSEDGLFNVDQAVQKILSEEEGRASEIIMRHKDKLEKLVHELMEKETLDIRDCIKILGPRPFPFPNDIADYLSYMKKKNN